MSMLKTGSERACNMTTGAEHITEQKMNACARTRPNEHCIAAAVEVLCPPMHPVHPRLSISKLKGLELIYKS